MLARRLSPILAIGCVLGLPTITSAQLPVAPSTVPLPPSVASTAVPLTPIPASLPAADPHAPPTDAVTLPLRLSLMSPGASHGCGQASVDSAGTILPVQPHTEVQLTLRLTFQAFSNLGCPGDPYAAFDAGMGGGLAYTSPLRPNLWLVGSVGGYGTPATGRSTSAAGLDLVIKDGDRSTHVGIGATAPRGRGVRVLGHVGGSF